MADLLFDTDSAWVTFGRTIERSRAAMGGGFGGGGFGLSRGHGGEEGGDRTMRRRGGRLRWLGADVDQERRRVGVEVHFDSQDIHDEPA